MKSTPLIVLFLVAVAVRQSASKYTTLLEDEPDDEPSLERAKPTTVSYGSLIYDPQQDQQQRDSAATAPGASNQNATSEGGGGRATEGGANLFSRLYSKVSSYLPFLAQLVNLRQPSGTNATASNVSELHAKTNVSVQMARDVSAGSARETGRGSGGLGTNVEGESSNSKAKGSSNDNIDQGANQDNQQQAAKNNDKQQRERTQVKVSSDRTRVSGQPGEQNQDDNDDSSNHDEQDSVVTYNDFVGQFEGPIGQLNRGADERQQLEQQQRADELTKSADQKRGQQYLLEDNNDGNNNYYYNADQANTERDELDVDMSQMVPVAIGLENLQRFVDQTDRRDDLEPVDTTNRYNMLRQSNLIVPAGSDQDMLTGSTASGGAFGKHPAENMLGRYIYAPTQHYYLNPVIPPQVAASQQHHVLANGKHIQPGDHIYSSYGPDKPMKAAYSYSKGHDSIADKPNDLYFLVMVGAFCMMATTIVLAAGLFAYRIQQSRKSSQDTGYPTYGVVGPNNLSAKCGAASLVGGYFTGPQGGAGCGSSKSGSARHLADLYGIAPNGPGGSDSGLNSLDKSSSNKKASSASSLNEFHQSATSRAASSNFMAAVSQDAARMYHYQHQKQQMIISDRNAGGRQTTASDLDSEDENDDGSYTVYECPGLASAHEMEIKNPLFNDDQSP